MGEAWNELGEETRELFRGIGMPLDESLTIRPFSKEECESGLSSDDTGVQLFFGFTKIEGRHTILYNTSYIEKFGLSEEELELMKNHELSHSALAARFHFKSKSDYAQTFNSASKSLILGHDGTRLYYHDRKLAEDSDNHVYMKTNDMAVQAVAFDLLGYTGIIERHGYISPETLAEYVATSFGLDELKAMERRITSKRMEELRKNPRYLICRTAFLSGLWLRERYGDKFMGEGMFSCYDEIINHLSDVHDYIRWFFE